MPGHGHVGSYPRYSVGSFEPLYPQTLPPRHVFGLPGNVSVSSYTAGVFSAPVPYFYGGNVAHPRLFVGIYNLVGEVFLPLVVAYTSYVLFYSFRYPPGHSREASAALGPVL